MRRRSGLVLLALTALWGCDSERLAPGTGTSLSLQVGTAAGFSSSADAGVVHIEGPTPRTVNIQPGETRTIEGLRPGSYTVALEALLQGRLESYDETTVTVVAGQNRQANLTLRSFTPGSLTVPDEAQPGVAFTIQFQSVTGAESYFVEWDDDPSFSSPTSVQTTATTAEVTLGDPGTHFVRVRARNRFGTDGIPTQAEGVTAVEAADEPIVRVGEASSSTADVGDQVALPIILDLSGAGGLEVKDLEIAVGFDRETFGAESWALASVDFDATLESSVEGTVQIARIEATRDADFGSSGVIALLTVDPATVGSGLVGVVVLSAADPDANAIEPELFEEIGHEVTIQEGNPDVLTLQPGEEVTGLGGGVHYFRVPVATGGEQAGARTTAEPGMVPLGGGGAHTRLGEPVGTGLEPFGATAGERALHASAPHVRVPSGALSDTPAGPGPQDAAMAAGQTLRIAITGGSGDADLYVRFGDVPTPNEFDCRPFVAGNQEECEELDPADGDWYVMIRPFGVHNAYTGLDLRAFLFAPVSITTAGLPSGVVGTSYEMSLAAADGDGSYAWTVASGDLPPGLELAGDGILSGTPTATGDFTFTVEVTSAGQAAQAQFTLTVAAEAIALAYISFQWQGSVDIDDFRVTNLAGGGVETSRLGSGVYQVAFGGIGVNTLGSSFTAYVTTLAKSDNPMLTAPDPTCTIESLDAGQPFTTVVHCDDVVTGDPMDARFRLMVVADNVFAGSGAPGQDGGFSVHTRGPTPGYAPHPNFSWNSADAEQSVSYIGDDLVRHELGIAIDPPFVQMVAPLGDHGCFLHSGSSTAIDVRCRLRDGTATDQRNHLAMQIQGGRPGTPFGYALVQASAVNDTYSLNPAGTIDVLAQETGKWRITFNGMTVSDFPAIDVTPVSDGWVHCSQFFSGNGPVTVDVACTDASGSFTNTGFFVTVLR